MTSYKMQFGSYVFPATIRPDGSSPSMELAEQERPRAPGATYQTGRLKSLVLSCRGELSDPDPATLLALYDDFKAGVSAGVQQLWMGRDDRYWLAQIEGITDSATDGQTWGSFIAVAANFRASDPQAWAATSTTVTGLGAGGTVTTVGSGVMQPAWSVTIGTSGVNVVTLANTTTGEVATVTGTFASGDVIILDRSGVLMTVTWNGTPSFGIFDGIIPQLVAGANTITCGATLGTVTMSVTYTERFV